MANLDDYNNVDDDIDEVKEAHFRRESLTGQKDFRFEIGRIAMSEDILDNMEQTKKELRERDKTPHDSFNGYVWSSFTRYCLCDWGDISPEEQKDNEEALSNGRQLFSVYNNDVYPSIAIITRDDRSETVIGLLSEVVELDE